MFDISTIAKSIVGFFTTLGVSETTLVTALSGTGVQPSPAIHGLVIGGSLIAGFLVWLKGNGPQADKVIAIIEKYLAAAQAAQQQVPTAPVEPLPTAGLP